MFKETFKYYKSKCPPPIYEKVIDFDKIDRNVSTNNEKKALTNTMRIFVL